MRVMGNRALQLCIAVCVALGFLSLGACSGGGGGITNPVLGQKPPSAPAAGTLSLVLTGAAQNANLPSVAGFTESISLPANNASSGTALSLTVSNQVPGGMPALAANMYVAQPFLYLTLNSNKTVTLNGYPGFVMTLPPGVQPATLPVKIGFYDSATGWRHIGDMTLSGSTATFTPASGAHVTLNANVNYYAITYTCRSSTLPLAGPGKPMPIPKVGSLDGTFIVPANNAAAGTTVTLTSFDVKPARAPLPQAVHRSGVSVATLSGGTVLFWVSTTYSSSFTFSAFPLMSFDLPVGTNTSGVTFYLETFDGPALIDQEAASSVSGLTVNFPGTAATFAIATGHTYWWELISVPKVTEFSLPSGSGPVDITLGPDGNLWFGELASSKIGRITPDGSLTEFPLPAFGGDPGTPRRITVGPDGNLWFTVPNHRRVGRITTTGVMTIFTLPTPGSRPFGITTGPDGNLWVTEAGTGNLARVVTDGTITEFPTLTPADMPFGIVTGPDGNLWVALPGTNQIARVVISTQAVTRFTIPTSGSFPNYIIANSGKLYFEENLVNKIGIITVAGSISEIVLPTSSSYPGFLTTGPDGHVWFNDEGAGTIGTIKTDGTVVELPIPTASSLPVGITSGPSRTIWFTEGGADKVGKFTVP